MAELDTSGVALRPDELAKISTALGREPSIVELHAFDAQWSEHCSYKSSRHHLKKLPTSGPSVVIGPGEDSGIVHLGEHDGERYGIVIAHESHNHPSQVVPFEGAATGIGGIVRDVLCMGAEVIAVADPLRFGRSDVPNSHQRYVAQAAVDGISAYGNAIGVPNIAGDVYFDERFDDNCLVNVVALGIVKESEIVHSYAPKNADGWDIILVGKATDPSGFGGASFSSLVLDAADQDSNKGAVQVPDPFLKNVLMRASYAVFAHLREANLTVGFKDLGAGGIMGCSAEICSAGGYGAIIDLTKVNLAIAGLNPEVIAIGETQERLIWVVPPSVTPEILHIYNDVFTLPQIAHNARAVVIGTVTSEKRYVLRYRGKTVMDVDIDVLTGSIRDDLPFEAHEPEPAPTEHPFVTGVQLDELLERVLAHPDVASREPLFRRYDAVVRGATVIPRGAADAGVLAPIPGSRLGVALAVAGNPRFGHIDARLAAEHAVYEAVRSVVAVGAKPIALTDCLNFGNPRKVEHYTQLVDAIDGLAVAARAFHTPFVSGNVSLYNEASNGKAVPASAIVSCVGALEDVSHVVTMPFKAAGSVLYFIGHPQAALGGSVLLDVLGRHEARLPRIDYTSVDAQHALMAGAARSGLLRSAHDIGNGGLIVAVCEMAFPTLRRGRKALGAQIDDPWQWTHGRIGTIEALFGEAGGFLVEVSASDVEAFEGLADDVEGVYEIGVTIEDPVLAVEDQAFDLHRLHDLWQHPLREIYP
ncbi:MAG TPA: phosphoribosylformylglycinamidine synthase subunit PurL [Candidatus Baltobacteraceae bacterium]|nr:phosphoribosylformylglycinamidine synthase subunit PurL [Candidatus Baltobacteraceae bacterium]